MFLLGTVAYGSLVIPSPSAAAATYLTTNQTINHPTNQPTNHPTNQPPIHQPYTLPLPANTYITIKQPTKQPTDQHTYQPTNLLTNLQIPTNQPSPLAHSHARVHYLVDPSSYCYYWDLPTNQPTNHPTKRPTYLPTTFHELSCDRLPQAGILTPPNA